ncbi:MAG: 30S ribosomal protein S20 [Patescibacteria group bacterium]
MPIKKAAYKALRSDVGRQARNQAVKVRIKNLRKKLSRAMANNEKDEAQKIAVDTYKSLDKAAQNKVMKKNTVSRLKSRISKSINRMAAPAKKSE